MALAAFLLRNFTVTTEADAERLLGAVGDAGRVSRRSASQPMLAPIVYGR